MEEELSSAVSALQKQMQAVSDFMERVNLVSGRFEKISDKYFQPSSPKAVIMFYFYIMGLVLSIAPPIDMEGWQKDPVFIAYMMIFIAMIAMITGFKQQGAVELMGNFVRILNDRKMTLEEKIDYVKVASYQMLGMWADMSQLVKLPEISMIKADDIKVSLAPEQVVIPPRPTQSEIQFEDV